MKGNLLSSSEMCGFVISFIPLGNSHCWFLLLLLFLLARHFIFKNLISLDLFYWICFFKTWSNTYINSFISSLIADQFCWAKYSFHYQRNQSVQSRSPQTTFSFSIAIERFASSLSHFLFWLKPMCLKKIDTKYPL